MLQVLVAPFTRVAVELCPKPDFLGLAPWYKYLSIQRDNPTAPCEIQNFKLLGSDSSFLLIALAILDDLIRVAALVAVGFVLYGGIQYIVSQGSPDSTKKAQQTILNALIGLALAIIASALVRFVGNRLGG